MRLSLGVFAVCMCFALAPLPASAQTSPDPTVTVPRVINVSGAFTPADGQGPQAVEVVILSIYAEPEGGLPLWQERQSVAVDQAGRFTLMAGATHPAGIPVEVFGAGQAQWMSLLFERAGEVEQPRVRITSVPYALKASDAETLGGLPASAYLRASTGGSGATSSGESAAVTAGTSADLVLPGVTNFLAKYVNGGADIDESAVYESGGAVGIGTTAPADRLHIAFNDPNGFFTGLAVQNTSAGAAAFSGMLFYDQTGALGQFQGFNNSTHEYRINNVARVSPGGAFNGSINFMTGSTSRFFVGSTGNIGIGTTSPSALLEVSNAVPGGPANMWMTSYTNNLGPYYLARRARGTPGAPTAVLNGDGLSGLFGLGHGTTGFGAQSSGMEIQAAENWTNTAQATRIQFLTTDVGTTAAVNRMTLAPSGYLGLGTNAPDAVVDVVRQNDSADFRATNYGGGDVKITLRKARGTVAAPSAVQLGDELGFLAMTGYGATGFGDENAGIVAIAAENWTNAARGTAIALFATPLGSTQSEGNLVVMPGGNVGIGTFTVMPTITDKLQVFGDIRIGTTGTNGCLRNFAGTGLIGTCVSDRRYKSDITPFAPLLGKLAALQPVHYFWRAADFPQQHFGDSRAYGLIAQDVEQILPELVVTNEDGFKAVDYSKLPLLTIQAVKELKAENDTLKQRIDELERLVRDLAATATHR